VKEPGFEGFKRIVWKTEPGFEGFRRIMRKKEQNYLQSNSTIETILQELWAKNSKIIRRIPFVLF
jgi:hypothetical protein